MNKTNLAGESLYHSLKKTFLIMRIAIILLLIGFLQTQANDAYSQKTKLSISCSNTELAKILDRIENQSEFYFLYNEKLIDATRKVSIEAKDERIEEVLKNLFSGTDVEYSIIDRKIILAPGYLSTSQQSGKKIAGKVSDSSGAPIPGATILVKGTTTGVTTANDGKFSLILPADAKVLVFSFVGMRSQEVAVGAKSEYNVLLSEESTGLEEVVLVGYGTSSRKILASAITSVKNSDLNSGSYADIGQLLQGKVPGLNISSSGNPNKPAAVVLRGASTINGSQGPFYVIDGVPGADISIIAPDDIETIDILKDAAATSIYGNRAANGVIMITTKKGKKGPMHVTYSAYASSEKVSNELDMMDATQLRAFCTSTNQSFPPADDKSANTNWQKAIERSSASSMNHNLSFSGGGEHNNYSASINYINKEGIVQKSNLSRVIARLSVEQYALNDKVKLGLSITNSNSILDNVPQLNVALLQSVQYLPVSPIKNPNGTYFENDKGIAYFNPVAMINNGKDQSKINNLVASFNAQVKLPFGLTWDLNVSYQNQASLHGEFYNSYYMRYNTANFYNNPDPPTVHGLVNFGTNGSALRNSYQNSNKILETFLTWDRKFGDHAVNAVVGYSWQGNVNGDGFQASTTNFPVDNIGFNNLVLSNPYAISSYRVNFGADGIYQETRLISDFARVNYNFREKYLVQGSVRRDGSSVFGANHQWGYFPSIGAAWRITQEDFMKNQNVFSDLKLRGSYGVTGNSTGFNAYTAQFMSGLLGTYYYNGTSISGYGPTQASNPDLKWEKTATANVGIDFTVLKGRVSGVVEVYDKKTTGMIYSYKVNPMLVPAGSIVANGGSMSNKGIEVTLNATPVSGKDFKWTTSINAAHNINKILSLTNPLFAGGDSVRLSDPEGIGNSGSTLQILKAGKPLGEFFTLQYAGKNSAGVSQFVAADGSLITNPTIGKDYHYAGSAQPKLLLGWNNTFRYKNFDLNVFVRGVFGNKIMNATRADLFRPASAHLTNILVEVAQESVTDLNVYKYSTRFLEDGNYLRLDNATLGYNFRNLGPHINNLRLYVSGNNLFVITKYKGIDPEINQGGIAPGVDSNNFFPKTRAFLFGVNLSF